jgi:K+-sensing histidine kinase KdpD
VSTHSEESAAVAAGGAALAIAVAAALVPLRNELGSANTALLLVLVVVGAAALGGRVAGVATGISASLAFNFLYTKPYLTLRIHSGRDVLTTGLIVVVGFAVGDLGVARARQSATRRSHLRALHSLESVGSLVSAGAPIDEIWLATEGALIETLGVKHATFQTVDPDAAVSRIQRDGRLDVPQRRYRGDGFALPASGAVLIVETDGVRVGNVLLDPNPEVGVTREQRRTAVAIVDQLAIALRNGGGATLDQR